MEKTQLIKPLAVYKRVSTDRQETLSQAHAIADWLYRNKPDIPVREFVDKFSGKSMDRPAFIEMQNAIRSGEVSGVVVFRLDRVGRNAIANVREVAGWIEQGLEFFAVDQPYLQLGKDNPLRMSLLGIFSDQAQMEREAIVSRVKAGLAAAKARGVRLGPEPRIDPSQILSLRQQGLTFRAIARKLGISASSAHRLWSESHSQGGLRDGTIS